MCVDIFSSMANLLRSFNTVSTAPGTTFTHGGGFQPTNSLQSPLQAATGGNDWFAWLMMAALLVFLIFGTRERNVTE